MFVVIILGVLISKFQTKVACCSSSLVHHSLLYSPLFPSSSKCSPFIILKHSWLQWSSISSSFFSLNIVTIMFDQGAGASTWVGGRDCSATSGTFGNFVSTMSLVSRLRSALIFQAVSLFVEFSSVLPHLHNKKISVVGHRRDSNVDLLSTHCG